MNVLITGVTGLIGKHLAEHFASLGHRVIGVGRRQVDNPDLDNYYQNDFTGKFEIVQEIDAIVHTAGQSPYNAICVDDFIYGNILTAKAVASLAIKKKVKVLIYLSSVSVYGDIAESVINEKTPIINPDIYGMTKYMGEKIFEEIAGNVSTVALRLPGVVGKGAHSCWLAKVVNNARQGLDICINNPASLFNNVISLNDLSNFIADLIETSLTGFDIITLGATNRIKIEKIVSTCVKNCKEKSKIKIEDNLNKPFTISIERAQRVYGFTGSKMQEIINKYLSEVCV